MGPSELLTPVHELLNFLIIQSIVIIKLMSMNSFACDVLAWVLPFEFKSMI